jgi:hypothetical protein
LKLRAGEWVEVRSRDEILATLDSNGQLDRMPFMPEMYAYCGKRFLVWKRAHKTCDTVDNTGGRRVSAAVHLAELRCDGQSHGGCEAACLLFWKEAWLKRIDDTTPTTSERSSPRSRQRGRVGATAQQVEEAACASGVPGSEDAIYSCQATMLPQASTFLPWWDVRQYVEDYASGNASIRQLVSGGAYVCYYGLVTRAARVSGRAAKALIRLYDAIQSVVGGVPYPRKWGSIPPGKRTPSRPLHLKAGDLVKVRPYEEVLSTLDHNNKNRGLYFDAEEVPYCDKTVRVRSTVSKIIDERTGRMLVLKDRNVILEGVICQARYSDKRMQCPRAIYPLWRETWLTPIEDAERDAKQ